MSVCVCVCVCTRARVCCVYMDELALPKGLCYSTAMHLNTTVVGFHLNALPTG